MRINQNIFANMKFLISSVLVLQVIWAESNNTSVHQSVEDYYWRDYNGLVPWDAILGGKNKNGDTTFICQFHIPTKYKVVTVPAIITKGSPNGRAAYGGVSTSNKDSDLKILCTSSPNKYMWISPTDQVSPRCHYVIGGSEHDVPHYIGRARVDTQILVGKIVSDQHPLTLRVPTDDGKEPKLYNFKILTVCY